MSASAARCAVVVSAALVVLSCNPVIRQFFDDHFYPQDRIYENKTLGFALTYRPGWKIAHGPEGMDKAQRNAARMLQNAGAELIFAGGTAEGAHGTRGIVENLNCGNEEYLEKVRKVNRANIDRDLGHASFMAGEQLIVKWLYEYRGMRFAEFLFRAATYNVRLAFWTKPDRFKAFVPVYEDIMGTLSLRVGY